MPVEDSLPVSGLRFPCLSADAEPCLVGDGRLFGWRLCQHKITSPFAGVSGGHHVTSQPLKPPPACDFSFYISALHGI